MSKVRVTHGMKSSDEERLPSADRVELPLGRWVDRDERGVETAWPFDIMGVRLNELMVLSVAACKERA